MSEGSRPRVRIPLQGKHARTCIVQVRTVRSAERQFAGTNGMLWVFIRRHVMKTLLNKLVRDEQGGEVLEYALIAGLIVVAAIAVITSVGSKVLARWTSLNASL